MNTTFCTVCSMNVLSGTACSDPDCPQLDEGDYIDPEFTDPEEIQFDSMGVLTYDPFEDVEFSDAEELSNEHDPRTY